MLRSLGFEVKGSGCKGRALGARGWSLAFCLLGGAGDLVSRL